VLEGEDGALNLEVAYALKDIMDRLSKTYSIAFYFKSSYDKANRSSVKSFRGPGIEKGLKILGNIASQAKVNIVTDIHSPQDAAIAADVADMLQIPAFLCRQTDLLVAAGKTGKIVNIKKGQFLAPKDVQHCAGKVRSTGNDKILITERGTSFGYNNLVVDMRSIPIVQGLGLPLIFDATHSVQLPGGQGETSGGQREFVSTLARAAVAAGCSGLFFETHPNPDKAPCDGPNMIPLAEVETFLTTCLKLRAAISKSE
jgi:2-dehydro-3-deoxyphosphooctonate aldolase (KDO 8-P synthase)